MYAISSSEDENKELGIYCCKVHTYFLRVDCDKFEKVHMVNSRAITWKNMQKPNGYK